MRDVSDSDHLERDQTRYIARKKGARSDSYGSATARGDTRKPRAKDKKKRNNSVDLVTERQKRRSSLRDTDRNISSDEASDIGWGGDKRKGKNAGRWKSLKAQ